MPGIPKPIFPKSPSSKQRFPALVFVVLALSQWHFEQFRPQVVPRDLSRNRTVGKKGCGCGEQAS